MAKNGNSIFSNLVTDYKKLLKEYNSIVAINNANVDAMNSMMVFMNMMSGVMYSLITGDPKCKDTLDKLSVITIDPKHANMNYLRNGLIVYIETLTETRSAEKAMQAWTEYLKK